MKLRLAVSLVILSYILGWPAVAIIGTVGVWLGMEELAIWIGSVAYALSWIVLGVGVWLGGTEATALVKGWIQTKIKLAKVSREDRSYDEGHSEYTETTADEDE